MGFNVNPTGKITDGGAGNLGYFQNGEHKKEHKEGSAEDLSKSIFAEKSSQIEDSLSDKDLENLNEQDSSGFLTVIKNLFKKWFNLQ